MNVLQRWLLTSLLTLGSLFLALVLTIVYFLIPQLPSANTLQSIELQVPLSIYSRDGVLIGEFGEQRRIPVTYAETPQLLRDAIVAAEDNRFYLHPGVDWVGLTRAAIELVRTGEKRQGGSTITMQVARNFFLTREKTYLRKLTEILLALRIERQLSKDQILELYINKIFLGQRAYGFGAAAQVYYGLELKQLELPQLAMLAGLPKAPSSFNPIRDAGRAVQRRRYVLQRMVDDGKIGMDEFKKAVDAPTTARLHQRKISIDASYAAEMTRAWVFSRFGKQAYTRGFRVETTIDSGLQTAANRSLRRHLIEYERRHDYRGPEGRLEVDDLEDELERRAFFIDALAKMSPIGDLLVAVVWQIRDGQVTVLLPNGQHHQLSRSSLKWSNSYWQARQENDQQFFQSGDLVRLLSPEVSGGDGWLLGQLPAVEGSLVSVDAADGAIRAINGGFAFARSHFNRVTQADRQPGSNFKPFIYTAALSNGFTAASLINDAPLVFNDDTRKGVWRPQNYSGKFFGPTRIRVALTKSRNLVSVRLLEAMGVYQAREYCLRFGFPAKKLPKDLSLALGSGAMTPLELIGGYAVLANGGYRVQPHLVSRVTDQKGEIVWSENFPRAAELVGLNAARQEGGALSNNLATVQDDQPESAVGAAGRLSDREQELAPRVLPEAEVFMINSILRDVIKKGTGRRALRLGRNDLAGKTGTTNNQRDAWFSGFAAGVVTTAWVGFDQPRSLGKYETGARAALPIWIDYMEEALKEKPELALIQPADVVTARIDPDTGELAELNDKKAIFEYFTSAQLDEMKKNQQKTAEQEDRSRRAELF